MGCGRRTISTLRRLGSHDQCRLRCERGDISVVLGLSVADTVEGLQKGNHFGGLCRREGGRGRYLVGHFGVTFSIQVHLADLDKSSVRRCFLDSKWETVDVE
jgi:hypothetical protein